MCKASDFLTTTTTKLQLREHLQNRLGLLPFRSRNLLPVAVFVYRIFSKGQYTRPFQEGLANSFDDRDGSWSSVSGPAHFNNMCDM